jgi:hypothetical protein
LRDRHASQEVYLTQQEKDRLLKISEETGKSVSYLLLHGFKYWVDFGSKERIRFARSFSATRELREIKENQRQSGDFLGSFDKKERKLAKLKRLLKKKQITREEYRVYVIEVCSDYEKSQKLFRKSRGIKE